MKIVAIGDTHGRSLWKKMIEQEKPDQVIFMGDYFDSKDGISAVEQIHNFKEIVDYKKQHPNTILLLGNHDLSYWPGIFGAAVSGYQPGAAANITQVLLENQEYLQMAYQDEEGRLYTHAGVSRVWLLDNKWDGVKPIVDFVNDQWKYKPLSFEFTGFNPYGDNESQGPTWIRPKSLMRSWKRKKDKPTQVVGHTQVMKIDIPGSMKWTNGKLFMIDALDTTQEYLIITDGELSVGKII